MKKTFWLFDMALIVIIFLLHEWTKRAMADGDVVANLLSAGGHVPTTAMIGALSFILLRLVVVVVLPAVMIGRWGLWLASWVLNLNPEEETQPPQSDSSTKMTQASPPAPPSSPWIIR